MAEDDQGASLAVSVTPRIPDHLDAKAHAEIRDAQDVMRQLIARMPRKFDHGDEIGLAFRPHRED